LAIAERFYFEARMIQMIQKRLQAGKLDAATLSDVLDALCDPARRLILASVRKRAATEAKVN
jgi:hypothetical protein